MSSSSNSRLAGGAVAHDGGDDVRPPSPPESLDVDVVVSATSSALATHQRERPEPRPGSRAHARLGLSPTPEGVSEHSWSRLAVHVSRALESATTRGATSLRAPVNIVAAELRLAGTPWDVIEQTIVDAITTHPDFGANDRLNVISGERSSATLIARAVGWVHRARQSETPQP